jgi:Ca2+/Na+ antiporter
MLLVAEILFAIWFYKSQSSIERTVAGSILALVFICLMIFVLIMNRTTDKEKTQMNHPFLSQTKQLMQSSK